MSVQEKLYTVDEFLEIVNAPENAHKRLELIDGVIVEMPSSSPLNTVIAGRIIYFLNAFVLPDNLGFVSVPDGGFALSPHHTRMPDAAFISRERMPELTGNVFPVAPDLAIEVISPSETARRVNDKIALYLQFGTRLVWAVYPKDQKVDVWRSAPDGGMIVHTLAIDDTLDGGDVLPGFTLPVRDVFPAE